MYRRLPPLSVNSTVPSGVQSMLQGTTRFSATTSTFTPKPGYWGETASKSRPYGMLSSIWRSVSGPMTEWVRSGSGRSSKSDTSERLMTEALMILACSGSSGMASAPTRVLAMPSKVWKLPSVATLPKTVYCPLRKFVFFRTMKNWELALFGSPALVMETIPRWCRMSLNSESIVSVLPPVPQVAGSPLIVFGSPPWITKLLITL